MLARTADVSALTNNISDVSLPISANDVFNNESAVGGFTTFSKFIHYQCNSKTH
jgi:hypothetical protein